MGSYLGQNFLHDTKIQHYIADKIMQLSLSIQATTIIEIGPGKGAITKKIHDICPHFFVVEKDPLMQQHLVNILTETQIVIADILDIDPYSFLSGTMDPNKTIVVGNLPYYITSPILRKFFGYGKQEWGAGFFMMQKEVGERIQTQAHKKSYLRWLLNHSYDVVYMKTVGAKSFRPAPKVQSCLILLTPKSIPWPIDIQTLVGFLDVFAPYSRKTLGKIAKMTGTKFVVPDDIASQRLEDCSIDDVVMICGSYHGL